MRFDAKCNAKANVLASIFCCCGCNSGTDFLQREMQKHSKWQKVEGKARNVCCCFYHSGTFYMGFSRCFFLEWFGQKVRFVKYVYRFNRSLKTSHLWHPPSEPFSVKTHICVKEESRNNQGRGIKPREQFRKHLRDVVNIVVRT